MDRRTKLLAPAARSTGAQRGFCHHGNQLHLARLGDAPLAAPSGRRLVPAALPTVGSYSGFTEIWALDDGRWCETSGPTFSPVPLSELTARMHEFARVSAARSLTVVLRRRIGFQGTLCTAGKLQP